MNEWRSIRKTRLFRVVLIVGVLFALVFWNPQKLWYPARMVFGFIATPFEGVFSVLGFHMNSSFEFLSSIGTLKQENERLTQENRRLISENAKLSDIQKENEVLRKEIGLLPRDAFRLAPAEVIGFDQQNAGNWLIIDKGSADGMHNGMIVIVDQSAVVGRISDVLFHSSKVILLTSPESVINGVDAQTEARGVVRGRYGLGIVMDTVLQTDVVKQGDDVITSGLGGDIPRGLFLGKVDTAQPSDDRLFQQVTLTPLVNILNVRTVFVILD